ncbi:MAG: PQQ-binding-like beta-propeller repeat protein [Pirellulales bacterium]
MTITRLATAPLTVLAFMACSLAAAGDWPQILGPARNGTTAADERILDAWPDAGPPVVWRRQVGAGVAGAAVAGGRLFLFHRVGDREVLEAVGAASGEPLWSDGHATSFVPQVGGDAGPLCTPVVAGDRVIVFGAQGVLACVEAATGKRLWSRTTHREFDAAEGYFGAGSTPLVIGRRVIVNVGGARRGAGVVAFDLDTGETLWTATDEPASYSAPLAVRLDGRDHALVVSRYRCQLLDAADGRECWSFPFGQRGPTVNAASPVVFGDGHLMVTAAYGIGSVYAAFDARSVTPVWQGTESLASQYATPVEVGGHLYAIDGRDDVPPAALKCLDRATGRVRWTAGDLGYGTLLAVDGKLLVACTSGELILVNPDPAGLRILGRCRPFAAAGGTLRALPALAAGRLYLRNAAELICLDLGPPGRHAP